MPIIHYLKILKSIINQSTNDYNYNYIKSPFNGVKFKVEKNSKSVLSEEDIDKLLNTPIKVIKNKGNVSLPSFLKMYEGIRFVPTEME